MNKLVSIHRFAASLLSLSLSFCNKIPVQCFILAAWSWGRVWNYTINSNEVMFQISDAHIIYECLMTDENFRSCAFPFPVYILN